SNGIDPSSVPRVEDFKAREFKMFSVGVGVPTISMFLDKSYGILDSSALVAFSINFEKFQFQTKYDDLYSYWSFGAGVIVNKSKDGGHFDFGIIITPYMFRYNDFAIGVGVIWQTRGGEIGFESKNIGIAMPITLQLI
ncbi:MAG: hypothetical protein OEZ36_13735, partial [Spirochaetota bacterium]|nr:hypothetical protein [Spirochaetota bacterium]